MQLDMYDGKDNPTVTNVANQVDSLAITVYRNNGGIWYSSNWNGAKTTRRIVDAKDVISVTGTGSSTTTVAAASTTQAGSAEVSTAKGEPASNLLEIYPNPMAEQATIHFHTVKGGKAQVYLYNQLGELVTTLYNAEVESGREYYLPV